MPCFGYCENRTGVCLIMEAGSLILRKVYELNECSHTWGSLITPQIKYASIFIRNKVVFLEERAHPRSLDFFLFIKLGRRGRSTAPQKCQLHGILVSLFSAYDAGWQAAILRRCRCAGKLWSRTSLFPTQYTLECLFPVSALVT